MSILNAMASQMNSSAPATAAKANRKPAEFWANIGIELPNGQFIKLPFNLPLDDMNKLEMRGTNQDWLQEAQVRNMLLEVVKGEAAKLDAGGSAISVELKVQLFRRSADQTPDESDNPLMAQLLQAFSK